MIPRFFPWGKMENFKNLCSIIQYQMKLCFTQEIFLFRSSSIDMWGWKCSNQAHASWFICDCCVMVVSQSESQWCVKVCPVKCLCCRALYQAWGVEHHYSNAQHKDMTALAAFHPAVEWSMPASTRLSLSQLTSVETQGEDTRGHTIQKTLNVSGECQSRARDISWIFPSGFFRVR